MKHLLPICFVIPFFNSSVFSQIDTTKLDLKNDIIILSNPFASCYFENKKYRKDGSMKKVIRHNGNGLTRVIFYNRNEKEIRTRTKKGPIMNQAPPCYHDK
jgi:hypothetical protein